jgi:FKBP-type peptidyl-prolyl cis-trans isomerase FklB
MKGVQMKLQLIAALGILLLTSQVSAREPVVLKDQKDKVSYSIGMNIGNNLKRQLIDVNPDALTQGLKDALSGGKALMTEKEVNDTLKTFQQELRAKRTEQLKKLSEKNKKEGDVFLAENKKKKDIITLPSGLQYKVIKEGTGEKPEITDTVTVDYRGTLINGTEFDSSYKRGKPATFPVNGVIAGWSEALQLMKVGSEWQLFIPPNLAYGERAVGRDIGPNATLIFDIKLLSIKEGAKKPDK